MLFQTEIIENTTTWWSRARRKTYQRICRRWCRRPRLAWPRAERKRSRMVGRETKARPSSCRGLSPFYRGDDPLRPSNSSSPSRRRRACRRPPTPDRSPSPSPNQATQLVQRPVQLSRHPLMLLHAPILLRVLSQPQAVSSLKAATRVARGGAARWPPASTRAKDERHPGGQS